MKVNMQTKIMLSAIAALVSVSAFAGAIDELSAADQNKVKNGEQVAVYQDVAGAPWPRVRVYQRVEATPEEAASVFFDVELQSSYVPNLLMSKINKVVSPTTLHVDYVLNIPRPFKDESYTVQDVLKSYDNGGSYRIDWTLVRADTTKATEGNCRFEALGTGTLISYTNFIIPGRTGSGLGWIVEGSKAQVRDTVTALIGQITKERIEQRGLLQQQLGNLRKALNR